MTGVSFESSLKKTEKFKLISRKGTNKWVSGKHVRVVGEVESLRQLEVELNGGALVSSLHRVHDGDIDLKPTQTREKSPLRN